MKKIILTIFVLSTIFIASCGHTNDLAKFDVNGSKILVNEVVKPDARSVKIEMMSTATENNKGVAGAVLDVIANVSTNVLAEDKQKKLQETIDTRKLLYAISDNLQNSLRTYLQVEPVESLDDNPDFICTINLEKCKLLLDQNKVAIYVNATASIVDRMTGQIAWENVESKTIPLSESYGSEIKNSTMESAFNALQLASLDENQINEIVDEAADDVGNYMAETLRDDVAEAHKQRMKSKNK